MVSRLSSATLRWLVFLAVAWGQCTTTVQGRETQKAVVTSRMALNELPAEGQQTYRLIHMGGPFPYEKDGSVFGNRERQLPRMPRAYYREYTVRTPGTPHRGARRIVCGGQEPARPDACYYTADHYASFRLIVGPKN